VFAEAVVEEQLIGTLVDAGAAAILGISFLWVFMKIIPEQQKQAREERETAQKAYAESCKAHDAALKEAVKLVVEDSKIARQEARADTLAFAQIVMKKEAEK
jgi:hypothetical protein